MTLTSSTGSSGVLIGLDIGTTNTKAVAFDTTSGRVIAVVSVPTRSLSPAPGWTEIDPEELWQGVTTCLRQVVTQVEAPVLGIGVSSMAEAGVPLDAEGKPLYRIIHWHDPRTEPQLRRTLAHFGPPHLFRVTGQAPRHVYSLYKLLWLREHEPDAFAALHRWLCISDYVAWRLTGVAATDFSLASRTMLLDQRKRQWSAEMLDYAEIRPEQLPELAQAGTEIGRVTAGAADQTHVAAGTPVVIGGHDHLCGSLAAGAVSPGQVVDSIGTAEGLVIPTPSFRYHERFWKSRICCYAHVLRGLFVVQGGMGLGGGALAWAASRLFAESPDPVSATLAAAQQAPPGAGGLVYFPYLGGNGSPVGDENVTAAFIGLRATHDRPHLARAVLEGIAFGIRHALEVASSVVGQNQPPLRVIGGGSRSPFWLDIRASMLDQQVVAEEIPESTALGAALLAGMGARIYPDAATAAAAVDRHQTIHDPDPALVERYDRLYHDVYVRIYPSLAPVFASLAPLAE